MATNEELASVLGDADVHELQLALDLSQLAYRNRDDRGHTPLPGDAYISSDSELSDAEALVGMRDGVVFVAYRGTEVEGGVRNQDWGANFQVFRKTLAPPGSDDKQYIHTGFYRQYESIRDEVNAAIRERIQTKPKYIMLTGHSLGGALAVLAAKGLAALAAQIGVKLKVYTFGQPKVGNEAFATATKDMFEQARDSTTYVRVVQDQDFVPLIPMASMGFVHLNMPFLLLQPDLEKSTWETQRPTAWQEVWKRTTSLFQGGISDHNLVKYKEAIDQLATKALREHAGVLAPLLSADPGLAEAVAATSAVKPAERATVQGTATEAGLIN